MSLGAIRATEQLLREIEAAIRVRIPGDIDRRLIALVLGAYAALRAEGVDREGAIGLAADLVTCP